MVEENLFLFVCLFYKEDFTSLGGAGIFLVMMKGVRISARLTFILRRFHGNVSGTNGSPSNHGKFEQAKISNEAGNGCGREREELYGEEHPIWDVLVIGGGHAGCEASAGAARVGAKTLLVTPDPEKIGKLSVNYTVYGHLFHYLLYIQEKCLVILLLEELVRES
jgi:hypothetical protein